MVIGFLGATALLLALVGGAVLAWSRHARTLGPGDER